MSLNLQSILISLENYLKSILKSFCKNHSHIFIYSYRFTIKDQISSKLFKFYKILNRIDFKKQPNIIETVFRNSFQMKRLITISLARVAQSAERSAVNRKVGGSNPPVSEFFEKNIIC